jgi:hypothetical protein
MRDLRSRLHDVVDVGETPPRGATATDDVLVEVLTARVRRRRGARAAAAGALGVATVAAVAWAGLAVGRGTAPAPPATQPAETAPTPTEAAADDRTIYVPDSLLACGEPVPPDLPVHPDLGLVVEAAASVPSGERVPWTLRWWSEADEPPDVLALDIQVAVVQDGVVVGSTQGLVTYDRGEPLPTSEAEALELSDATEAARCGLFRPLPAGEYSTLVVVTLVTADRETVRAAAPPRALTVTEARPRVLACGDLAPMDAPVDAAAPLTLDATTADTLDGDALTLTARVTSASVVDLAWQRRDAEVVLTRSGLVVATGRADLLPTEVAAGATAAGPEATVRLEPCDGQGLEPGRHEVWLHATFDPPGREPLEVLAGRWPVDVE